jgi:hypothetical protein
MTKLVYAKNESRLTLQDVFNNICDEETRAHYLIPDLQRAFIWETKKITDLIDSIFKGWPFGQVLLANTGDLSPMFSPRAFYQKIDVFNKTNCIEFEPTFGKEVCLVLDGQQRLQSLFLVFSPFSRGFICPLDSWVREYHDWKSARWMRYNPSPQAYLSLNIENYCIAFESETCLENIDFSSSATSPILEWCFADPSKLSWNQQKKLIDYKKLLPHYLSPPSWDQTENRFSHFIPLKDFWGAKDFDVLLGKYQLDSDQKEPISEFYNTISALKHLEIPHTCILSQTECNCSSDNYNEMIISIFTRLNAGGIPLSREDITFAWIKRYWNDEESGENIAQKKLTEILDIIKNYGINIKSDALVRYLSDIWAIIENNGQSLKASDFLRGDLLKQIALFLKTNWETISRLRKETATVLNKHGLCFQRHYYSLDGFFLIVSWQTVAELWRKSHANAKVAETQEFDSLFGIWIENRIDRFMFAGQWAGTFGSNGLSLSKLSQSLQHTSDYKYVTKELEDWFLRILDKVIDSARNKIRTLNKTTRAGVSAYTTYLWCWQRLTPQRKTLSDGLEGYRGGISMETPNVDHCVACNFWDSYIPKYYQAGSDMFNSAKAEVNQIGNCNVLCKSVNCAKSDYTMKQFFDKLELSESDAACLEIPIEMFVPDTFHADIILEKMRARTKIIRKDLIDFLEGNKNIVH